MPFPRVAEITDAIACLLSQGDNDDDDYEAIQSRREDLSNFRLVCKDFAAIGARYLFPTVSLIRIPEAFQTASEIAEHPLLRFHVKTLIFYYDTVTIVRTVSRQSGIRATTAAQIDHFQASGQDIDKFAKLLDRFPRLKRIEIRSLAQDIDNWGWHSFAESMNKRLGYGLSLRSSPGSALKILHVIGAIETLVLSNSLHASHIRSSVQCFGSLKTLKITNPWYGRKSSQWAPPGLLLVIKELEYIGPHRYRTFFVENEVITALPASLQNLRLQHIECFDESFPTNLDFLELNDVLFDLDAFPSALSRVSLSNVRLVGSNMTKWAAVLLSLKAKTQLTISGCLTVCNRKKLSDWLDDDPTVPYLHCRDTVVTDSDIATKVPPLFVGELLMTILQSDSSDRSPRAALLRLLFDEHNSHINPGHNDLHRDAGRQVPISRHFEALRQELTEGRWASTVAPNGKVSDCTLCYNQFCSYSYMGVVG